MVKITLIIEGGIIYTETADANTLDNSQALRESLHRLFSKLLNQNVSIVLQMGAGYRCAALQFAKKTTPDTCLYVDLDNTRDNIPAWFEKLKTENPNKPILIPTERRGNVFFMIQEMEAWVLKQPAAIERWADTNGYVRLHTNESIENHSLIANKPVEEIKKPSQKLELLIKHFFEKRSPDGNSKVRYGKLKSASGIIDQLDATQLLNNDAELKRFCQTINDK